MNKFKLLLLAVVLVFATSAAKAQKVGYISLDEVISLMPEVGKIDTALQRFQLDTLGGQYEYMLSEYQRKDSLLNSKDSAKHFPNAAVRSQVRQELAGYAYQLQNWQQFSSNALQSKQSQLLQPVYARAMNAIRQVTKDKGYSHVYDKSAFVIAPDGDDLLPAVAARLNLKLPQGYKPGLRQ